MKEQLRKRIKTLFDKADEASGMGLSGVSFIKEAGPLVAILKNLEVADVCDRYNGLADRYETMMDKLKDSI